MMAHMHGCSFCYHSYHIVLIHPIILHTFWRWVSKVYPHWIWEIIHKNVFFLSMTDGKCASHFYSHGSVHDLSWFGCYAYLMSLAWWGKDGGSTVWNKESLFQSGLTVCVCVSVPTLGCVVSWKQEAFLCVMTYIRKSITRSLQSWIHTSQAYTYVHRHMHTLTVIHARRGWRALTIDV